MGEVEKVGTTESRAYALAQNQASKDKIDAALARKRRHARTAAKLQDRQAELMRDFDELNSRIMEERADAWEAQVDAWKASSGFYHVPFDAPPDEIENVTQWSRDLRCRAWATAFSHGPSARLFSGRTGTRDLMLFISLCFLAEQHDTQTVEKDIPDIVMVSAMDNKTVVDGLGALRNSGLLLRVGVHSHVPIGTPLIPASEAPELSQKGLGERFCWGNRAHDSFGGQYGIKPVWIRLWVWLYLHPGATRAEIAKGAWVKAPTVYRVLEKMQPARMVRIDASGHCFAIEPQTPAKHWLDQHTDKRGLSGTLFARVKGVWKLAHPRIW